MIHAGMALARRIEIADARIGAECAAAHQRLDPALGAAVIETAGGYAIFVGTDSPLTHAAALGLQGPVRGEELDVVEEFFRSRDAPVNLELCPLADLSLVELTAGRGYSVTEFSNVLVRPLSETPFLPEPAVRLAHGEEEALWVRTVGRGFLEKDELSQDELNVGAAIWHMSDSRCYLAWAEGQPAAAAALSLQGGLATLFADSTVAAFRRCSLQSSLIRARLCDAAAAGCDLATASTMAGSTSQRNYERLGFQVAYTKVTLAL